MPIEGGSHKEAFLRRRGVPENAGPYEREYFLAFQEIREKTREIFGDLPETAGVAERWLYAGHQAVNLYFAGAYNPLGLTLPQLKSREPQENPLYDRKMGHDELWLTAMAAFHIGIKTDTEEGRQLYQHLLSRVSQRQCLEREYLKTLIGSKCLDLNNDERLLLKVGMETGVYWDDLYSLWREIYLYKQGFKVGDQEKLGTVKAKIITQTERLASGLADSGLKAYFFLLGKAVGAVGEKSEEEEKRLWDELGEHWGKLECRVLPVASMETLYLEGRCTPEFGLIMKDPLFRENGNRETIKNCVIAVLERRVDSRTLQPIKDHRGNFIFSVLSAGARIDFSYAGQGIHGRNCYDKDSWVMGVPYRQLRTEKVFGEKVTGEEEAQNFFYIYLLAHEIGHLFGQDSGDLEEVKANLIGLTAINYGLEKGNYNNRTVEAATKDIIASNLRSLHLYDPFRYQELSTGNLRELVAALGNLSNACQCGLIVPLGDHFTLDLSRVGNFLRLSAEKWNQLAEIIDSPQKKQALFEGMIGLDGNNMVAAIRKKLIS